MEVGDKIKTYLTDSIAGAASALILIPGCIAVSTLAGMPLMTGFIGGVVSALIMGAFGSIYWQITAPAISLTMVSAAVMKEYGISGFIAAVLVCGLAQVLVGLFKWGKLFRMLPPFLLQGVLTGLGIDIIIQQAPMAFASVSSVAHYLIPIFLLLGLLVLPHLSRRIPWVPTVVVIGSAAYHLMNVPMIPINMPKISEYNWAGFSNVSGFGIGVLTSGLSLFLISSSKFLLTSSALESRGAASDVDRDSIWLGISNVVCGVFGALPVTSHVGRSFLLKQMNPATRMANWSQALWLVLVVVLIPQVFVHIPAEVIATLLVYTGITCIDWNLVQRFKAYGQNDFVLFVMTAMMVVFAGINSGVIFGIVAAAFNLLVTFGMDLRVKSVNQTEAEVVLELEGAVTFISLPTFHTALTEWLGGKDVRIDLRNVYFFDESCLGFLDAMETRFKAKGQRLSIDTLDLEARLGKTRNLRTEALEEIALLDRRREARVEPTGRRQIDRYLSQQSGDQHKRPVKIDDAS